MPTARQPLNPDEQPTETTLPADLPRFPVYLAAPDLSPWEAGNTGIPGCCAPGSRQPSAASLSASPISPHSKNSTRKTPWHPGLWKKT